MYQQEYYVPKATGTLSDLMLAFGAAVVLDQFVHKHVPVARTTLRDGGGYHVIDTGVPVEKAWVDSATRFDPIEFVTGPKFSVPADLAFAAARNVDEVWDSFRRYTDQRRLLGEQGLAGEELAQAVADLEPEPDWTVVTYLGDYRMQAQGIHNRLVELWARSSAQLGPLNMRTLLQLFSAPDADWPDITQAWKLAAKTTGLETEVTASQLLNPHMGKGQNSAKANKLTLGNEKSFWMLEFLKAVGLWAAAAPTKATNADLRKTYVLAPIQLEIAFHRRVFQDFRRRLWNSGAVKQDITAGLLYVDTLLAHSVEEDRLAVFDDGPISNVVSGMAVATYQLLSQNSYTTMNLAYLGLPDWMPQVRTDEDALMFRAILQEHLERVRAIDEDVSEGYALLQRYRDFLSAKHLTQFFDFCTGYSSYLVSQLDRGRFYVKPFSETNLRRLLIMLDQTFAPILEDEGFQNVARAIRLSTVVPLYLGRQNTRFDVRYGLGQELRRKGQYGDDFVRALSDFMQEYNDETMRVHERTKGRSRRKLITTQDIAAVVRLIDRYDAKTISSLLVAFGYARDPRSREDEQLMGQQDAENEPADADMAGVDDVDLVEQDL